MAASMRSSAFLHIAWKEYRTLRDFWLACLVLTALLQMLCGLFPTDAPNPWLMAIVVPGFFALGAGAIAFSAEAESGTDDLLRTWSATYPAVLLSKICVALAGTALLFITLAIIASLFSMEQEASWQMVLSRRLVHGLGMGAGLFTLALLFSLFVQRTLTAIWMAAAAWMLLMMVTSYLWDDFFQAFPRSLDEPPNALYLASVGLILLADIGLSRLWVRGSLGTVGALVERFHLRQWTLPRRLQHAVPKQPIRNLLWREARLLPFAILGLPFLHVLCITGWEDSRPKFEIRHEGMVFPLLLSGLILGIAAFHAEQRGQIYRFLSERGISPFHLWLAKQVCWLPLLFVNAAAGWIYVSFGSPHEGRQVDFFLAAAASLPLLGWAVGQWCALLIPAAVIATCIALSVCIMLSLWFLLMLHLGIPTWWSVTPLPIAILGASLLCTRDLLTERQTWRTILQSVTIVLVPTVLIVALFARFRAIEIPRFHIHVAQFHISAAAEETVSLYREAMAMIQPRPSNPDEPELSEEAQKARDVELDRQWLAENQPALVLALTTAKRPECAFSHPERQLLFQQNISDLQKMRDLARLVILSAGELTAQGKLDEALQRYQAALNMARHVAQNGENIQWLIGTGIERRVAEELPKWAAHPDQTRARLKKAIAMVKAQLSSFPPLARALEAEYASWLHFLTEESSLGSALHGSSSWTGRLSGWFEGLFPWERERTNRLFENYFGSRILTARRADETWSTLDRSQRIYRNSEHISGQEKEWIRTTIYGDYVLYASFSHLEHRALTLRGLTLQLALQGYKLQHGEYPETLDALIGPWLDSMPLDPFSGQEFHYRPTGFPTPVYYAEISHRIAISAHKGLLWSAGTFGIAIVPHANALGSAKYRLIVEDKGYSWSFDRSEIQPYLFFLPEQ